MHWNGKNNDCYHTGFSKKKIYIYKPAPLTLKNCIHPTQSLFLREGEKKYVLHCLNPRLYFIPEDVWRRAVCLRPQRSAILLRSAL